MPTKDVFAEIKKLHEMLTEAHMPHTFAPVVGGGFQIRLYTDHTKTKEIDDCICHKYSHGFYQGLLETYVLNNCEGYETAEQVFEGWKQMYGNDTTIGL